MMSERELDRIAFPSAPRRSAKYELHCHIVQDEEEVKNEVRLFGATFSAKKFVEALIGDDKFEWTSDHAIRTAKHIVIHSHDLTEIMEHKYSNDERKWELPEPYASEAKYFAVRRPSTKERVEEGQSVAPTSKERKEKKTPTPRPDTAGLVTPADLAKDHGVDPRDIRGALRKAGIEKPYAWPEEKVGAINDKIKPHLKKKK